MRNVALCLFSLVLLASPIRAQQQEYTRFLLPLVPGEQPGAHGAVWRTLLDVANDSDRPLDLRGDAYPPLLCGPVLCASVVQPGQTFNGVTFDGGPVASPPALLYSIRRELAGAVAMAIRLSGRRDDPGVRVPVIAEDEYFGRPANLLGVEMTNDRQRTLLRLYDPDAVAGSALRVRAFTGGGQLIADHVVPLHVTPEPGGPRRFPGYAAVVIAPSFFSLPNVSPDVPVRIRIEPHAPGQRFWAMASITNNATNQVTLVVPEP